MKTNVSYGYVCISDTPTRRHSFESLDKNKSKFKWQNKREIEISLLGRVEMNKFKISSCDSKCSSIS